MIFRGGGGGGGGGVGPPDPPSGSVHASPEIVGTFPGLNQYSIEYSVSARENNMVPIPLVNSTGIIQLFGHCIVTWYAMLQSYLKLTEIGTSCGRG